MARLQRTTLATSPFFSLDQPLLLELSLYFSRSRLLSINLRLHYGSYATAFGGNRQKWNGRRWSSWQPPWINPRDPLLELPVLWLLCYDHQATMHKPFYFSINIGCIECSSCNTWQLPNICAVTTLLGINWKLLFIKKKQATLISFSDMHKCLLPDYRCLFDGYRYIWDENWIKWKVVGHKS